MQQLQGFGSQQLDAQPLQEGDRPSPTPLEPAGFGIRAGAYLIDVVVVGVIAFVAAFPAVITLAILASTGIAAQGWQQRMGQQSVVSLLTGLVATIAYHALAEGLGGATVGKAILGLRVLTEDRLPCTVPKALGRSLAFHIDALFFGLVGYSAMSKSRMQQRHGDRWAGTIVIHKRSATGFVMRSPVVGILCGALASGAIDFAAVLGKGL